jgi:hypothetical protein
VVSNATIAVAPNLHRIFVPVAGRGYVAIEDDVPDPAPADPLDPDRLTDQNATKNLQAAASGHALAHGAHVLVTGGLPRVADQVDPFCNNPAPDVQTAGPVLDSLTFEKGTLGSCLADQALAPGNRELLLAASDAETNVGTQSVAMASGLTFPRSDTATDADLKRVPMTSSGTAGPDGRGAPIPRSECTDFGDGRKDDQQAPTPGGLPQSAVSSSKVTCDEGAGLASGSASASGFSTPDPSTPGAVLMSVAEVSSAVQTWPTDDGQRTVATASATGVRLGPVSIGEVRTQAVSVAHGRAGTALTSFDRWWCAISGPGFETDGCINPADPANQDFLDQVNQALGKVRITVTPANGARRAGEATPGGYQAVVTKDPGTADADRSVNDDDSQTVSGLQAVFYNDGSEGRSRAVVQLAGVHTESRYGITEGPDFGSGADPTPPPTTPEAPVSVPEVTVPPTPAPAPAAPAAPTTRRTTKPGTKPAARHSTPAETVRSLQPSQLQQASVSHPKAAGSSLVQQVIRTPGEILRQAIELLVTHPGEFALLFGLWALLAAPIYLGLRRRALAQALAV